MISICIPAYNYDVNPLVRDLLEQLSFTSIEYEVRVYDDASTNLIPISLTHDNLIYKQLDANLGRAAIRNLLAKDAIHENILFLDGDVIPSSELFISRYIQQIGKAKVLIGGRSYAEQPSLNQYLLHWRYGMEREVKPAEIRNNTPYNSFMTNNFLIEKECFLSIGFEESIVGYGHEDTYFGYQLMREGVSVLHLDNPAIHVGLDDAGSFLSKSESAVHNLMKIRADLVDDVSSFDNMVKLLRYRKKIKRFGMAGMVNRRLKKRRDGYRANLLSNNPKLRNLDLLKLSITLEIDQAIS